MDKLVQFETKKDFERVCSDLAESVASHGFGVLHVHDIKQSMAKKGVPFERDVRIFDICNPHRARDVLEKHVEFASLLPCSVAVWSEGKRAKVAFVRPSALLGLLGAADVEPIAAEVERTVHEIVEEAVK